MSGTNASTLASEVLTAYEHVRKGNLGTTIQDRWAAYWGTTYGTGAFWFAYAQYSSKLDELKQQIEYFSKDNRSKELFSNAVTRLKSMYDVSHIRNSVTNLSQLDETFNIIHLASNILPTNGTPTIEPVTVETVSAQISDLIDGIETADFDDQLARFLRGQLTFLRWAVENYPSLGIDGLSKAYGMVASEFARAWSTRGTPDEEKEKWWHKAKTGLKLIGEGVIWGEKVAAGAEKLLAHADDIAGIIN